MKPIKKILIWTLNLESRLILRKYKPFIVAVTGSVGKTSTKDAIYCVLKDPALCRIDGGICYVRKTDKSMNSDIGLPLTVIGVPNAWHSLIGWFRNVSTGLDLILRRHQYPDCLVLEVGADHPGDIRKIARWLRPDIAVITLVSRTPVHVEFFDSPEQVFEEKAALAEAVKKDGVLVLFADDERTASMAERVKAKGTRVLTFGIDKPATVRGSGYHVDRASPLDAAGSPTGFSFTLDILGESSTLAVPGILGQSSMYPLLAAAAVGKARDLSPHSILQSLSRFEPPRGRMDLIPGLNGSTLIDDTYNSSPDAAMAALQALKNLELVAGASGGPSAGRRIAVLGDMMELGTYSGPEHRRIGREAVGVAGILVTVGQRSRATAEEAISAGLPEASVRSFDTSLEAAAYLAPLIHPGDIVLIKGSQSMRMERAVKALMRDPDKAPELLVRQEKEWIEKE